MPKKILMVCLGNICRSPLAEGILAHLAADLDLVIDSAGTGDWHQGQMPDVRSIAIANKYGIDITNQRARHFKAADLDRFDCIYAMDKSNYENILRLAKTDEQRNKVKLILNESFPDEDREVPDPYYRGDDGFDNVYLMLEQACKKIITQL